jgi:hypothetical protein
MTPRKVRSPNIASLQPPSATAKRREKLQEGRRQEAEGFYGAIWLQDCGL